MKPTKTALITDLDQYRLRRNARIRAHDVRRLPPGLDACRRYAQTPPEQFLDKEIAPFMAALEEGLFQLGSRSSSHLYGDVFAFACRVILPRPGPVVRRFAPAIYRMARMWGGFDENLRDLVRGYIRKYPTSVEDGDYAGFWHAMKDDFNVETFAHMAQFAMLAVSENAKTARRFNVHDLVRQTIIHTASRHMLRDRDMPDLFRMHLTHDRGMTNSKYFVQLMTIARESDPGQGVWGPAAAAMKIMLEHDCSREYRMGLRGEVMSLCQSAPPLPEVQALHALAKDLSPQKQGGLTPLIHHL